MKNQRFTFFVLTLMLTLAAFAGAQEATAPEAAAPETPAPEAAAPEAEQAPAPESQEESGELVLSDPDSQETLVVTGKAVNASPGEIIVETEEGRRVFVVDTESLHPEPITEGQTVTVWYVERADQLYATALETGDHLNPETLPQTASRQPLLALASLIAFAGALSLWGLRKLSER